jgi:hypothetical protein
MKRNGYKINNIKELIDDEILNARLYDHQSFQYILDRELHRQLKNQDRKSELTSNTQFIESEG